MPPFPAFGHHAETEIRLSTDLGQIQIQIQIQFKDLAAKQAVWAAAKAKLTAAEADLAEAQAWYDRTHPKAAEGEGTLQQASADAKLAGAQHAKADGSQLAQTGDAVGEVFWVAGIAFVAAGVTIGGSMAARKRKLEM